MTSRVNNLCEMGARRFLWAALLLRGLGACTTASGPTVCTTSNGRSLAAGEFVAGDACHVCDATEARMMPRWSEGCGQTIQYVLPDNFAPHVQQVGDDVDGDGHPELLRSVSAIQGFSEGRIQVISLATGEILYEVLGSLDHPIGKPQQLGGDVDGDGSADLLFVESWGVIAGAEDSLGGASVAHGEPNIVHMRSPATGEEIWTQVGPGGCHALGMWALFTPDFDGDGAPDVLLMDPGCVQTYNVAPDRPSGVFLSGTDASMQLRSGRDGILIREWNRDWLRGLWGQKGVGMAEDLDDDGDLEIYVYSEYFGTSGGQNVEVYSVHSDTPIAQYFPLGTVGGVPYGDGFRIDYGAGFLVDLTGDGQPNILARASRDDGSVEIGILSDVLSPRPMWSFAEWRVPGSAAIRHDIAFMGRADVNGDGEEELVLVDHDAGREGPRRGRLLAVSLDGDVVWMNDEPVDLPAISGGVVDVDGDGRVDFVANRTIAYMDDSVVIELSSGFGRTP